MGTHRFAQIRPVELRKIDQQIAVGVTAAIVGQSPDLFVDISLTDDAALDDLKGYMLTLGWQFVTSNPTSPRPVLATQYQTPVIAKLADPPVGPSLNDRYIVIATATGAWIGHENEIAEWDGTAWQFTAPTDGMTTWDQGEQEPDTYAGSWEASNARQIGCWEADQAILTAATPPTVVDRNGRRMLSFPKPGGMTTAYFAGVVPRNYVTTAPLRAKIFWVAETAVAGNARWVTAMERLQPNGPNVDSDNFGGNQAENSPTNATNGLINSTIIPFTNAEADNIRPGNPFRFRVQRAAGAAGDTMTGNAQVMRVALVQ